MAESGRFAFQEEFEKVLAFFETTTQKTENHIILKRIFRIIKDPFKGLSNRRHLLWRRVGDSNSRCRSPHTSDLANRPLQPLG